MMHGFKLEFQLFLKPFFTVLTSDIAENITIYR